MFLVKRIVFSPDGRYVVAGGNESNLAIWQIATGRELFRGKINGLSADVLAFSPNNQILALGNSNELEFYEIVDGSFRYHTTRIITNEIFSVRSLAFSPNGKKLAIGNFFDGPLIWDVTNERVVYELAAERGVSLVDFSPDGNTVLGSSTDKNIYEWRLREELSDEDS